MSMQHLIGIAQMMVSDSPDDILVAPNLGSCLGISVYDPITRRGGLIHCLLPFSKSDPVKAAENPCMYVDTGLTLLLEQLLAGGTEKRKLEIVAAGGANINDDQNVFEIGKRNYTVLKKILWKNSLVLRAESIGENYSRTLTLHVNGGKVELKSRGTIIEL